MDLRQIQAFVEVADTGSFSKAANHLFVTQPTISSHIKLLEEELGVELLNRSTRKIVMTDVGKDFYQSAKSIVKIINNIPNSISDSSVKQLKIGSSSAPLNNMLPNIISKYHNENPLINFYIDRLDTLKIIEGVLDGTYHLGVVGNTILNSQLTFEKIKSDQLVIIMPNNQKYIDLLADKNTTISLLLKEPMIFREEGSATREEAIKLIDNIGFDINDLNVVAYSNDLNAQKELVSSGLGISIVSETTVQKEIENQQVLKFELDKFSATRHFYVVYRNGIVFPELISLFIQYLKEEYN